MKEIVIIDVFKDCKKSIEAVIGRDMSRTEEEIYKKTFQACLTRKLQKVMKEREKSDEEVVIYLEI